MNICREHVQSAGDDRLDELADAIHVDRLYGSARGRADRMNLAEEFAHRQGRIGLINSAGNRGGCRVFRKKLPA